jgi:hypothetical protein
MTNAIARPGRSRRTLRAVLALSACAAGCASFVEVPVETPLQSKLDVSSFRRVLIAGFVSDLVETDVDVSSETARLIQNQLRSSSKLQVLDPDRPPLQVALEKSLETLGQAGEGGRLNRQERDQLKLEADRVLQDAEFWRRIGEEFQNPLIITGKLGFEQQNRSGFTAEERVMTDRATGRPRLVRGNRYLERKGFNLNADFYFIDGKTGALLHKEKFTEEVLYSEDQKVYALSSYFELMDRLLPNFMGVISPQRIRGTRILLQ